MLQSLQRFNRHALHAAMLCVAFATGCVIAPKVAIAAPPPGAGAYPERPLKVIVPFAAGGFTDTFGRVVSQKLSVALGQPVIVENRTGAGGNIGAEFVAKDPGDPYLLFVTTNTTHGVNPTLYRNIPFDAVKDFTPIALLVSTPNLLVVANSSSINSVADLVAQAKARPGQLFYASTGIGSSPHLQAELFNLNEHISMKHVPYRGSPQAVVDLIGGTVQMMFDNISFEYPLVQAGKVRALAVTAKHRSPLLPSVPTMSELGISGFEFGPWFGFSGPANMPKPVVSLLNTTLNKIIAMPDVQAKLKGTEVLSGTPEQFAAFIGQEIAKWRKVILSINLQVQ